MDIDMHRHFGEVGPLSLFAWRIEFNSLFKLLWTYRQLTMLFILNHFRDLNGRRYREASGDCTLHHLLGFPGLLGSCRRNDTIINTHFPSQKATADRHGSPVSCCRDAERIWICAPLRLIIARNFWIRSQAHKIPVAYISSVSWLRWTCRTCVWFLTSVTCKVALSREVVDIHEEMRNKDFAVVESDSCDSDQWIQFHGQSILETTAFSKDGQISIFHCRFLSISKNDCFYETVQQTATWSFIIFCLDGFARETRNIMRHMDHLRFTWNTSEMFNVI